MAVRSETAPQPAAGTVQLNARVDPALKDQFRKGCQGAGRHVQEVIAELMEEWLERPRRQ